MDCPHCKKQLKVTATAREKGHVYRILKCKTCDVRFTSDETLYAISTKKGEELMHTTYRLKNEQNKLNAAMARTQSRPKGRRKVAPKPSTRVEGEVYLTYGEIFEKFKEQDPFHGECLMDYRPYPLLDYSIIVWVKKGHIYRDDMEIAYQYNPETNGFTRIRNAKTYEEILNEKARK